jgi:two-component system, LytTR family, response regulator
MYTAIIVDDEELGAETLSIMVQKFCPEITLLGIANDVNEAIEMLYELNPTIVFLDIDLPSGTGFDILNKTTSLTKEIIFTTAHAEHAIKAIKENACDYILKPILVPDLVEAVAKAKKKIDELKIISSKNRNSTKISIPSSDGIHLFNTS